MKKISYKQIEINSDTSTRESIHEEKKELQMINKIREHQINQIN